jgi:uncharacterized membrane protein YedE/YeeE
MAISNDILMAVLGGAIIALATSLNLFLKGRITGISGIVFGFITLSDFIWKSTFLLGLMWISTFFNVFIEKNFVDSQAGFIGGLSLIGFCLAGFLVGFGTKWANGCTSGHGVCGIPRFSIRSIVSCCIFCAVGILTATFRHQEPFLNNTDLLDFSTKINTEQYKIIIFCSINALIGALFTYFFISLLCGILFGCGLIISGMNRRTKVINFLDVTSDNWDPSLLFVLISAVCLNIPLFHYIIRIKKKPLLASKHNFSDKTNLDFGILFGSAIFGLGWGISGLCPGPVMVNLFNYVPHVPLFFLSMCIGQYFAFKFVA